MFRPRVWGSRVRTRHTRTQQTKSQRGKQKISHNSSLQKTQSSAWSPDKLWFKMRHDGWNQSSSYTCLCSSWSKYWLQSHWKWWELLRFPGHSDEHTVQDLLSCVWEDHILLVCIKEADVWWSNRLLLWAVGILDYNSRILQFDQDSCCSNEEVHWADWVQVESSKQFTNAIQEKPKSRHEYGNSCDGGESGWTWVIVHWVTAKSDQGCHQSVARVVRGQAAKPHCQHNSL